MAEHIDVLDELRVLPVVVIRDAGRAPDLAKALRAGGGRAVEITLRTPEGLPAIASASRLSDILVGAGTVLTAQQVDECVDAGARFIVSPGLSEEVVNRARERGVLAIPGVATATELQSAVAMGLSHVKFFPADRLGGLDTIRSLGSVFPAMKFMPSGGVSADNARSYLADPAVFAVSGSWMAPESLIDECDFEKITNLTRAAMST